MKRRLSLIALTLSFACITGCGNMTTDTELPEENQKLVAEYAAGLLLKYNAGGGSRILEGQKLAQEEAKEAAEAEREQKRLQAAADYQASKEQPKANGTGGNGGTGTAAQESYIEDVASLFGFDDFSVRYTDCEITDSYPSGNREDMFMAMDATPGRKLLVAKFAVTNEGGQAEEFDMFEKQGKFRLNTQEGSVGSQYTLLLDDLSVYKGEIEAGQSEEMVLIFEISEALAENPGEMTLSISYGGSKGNVRMQ